MPSEMTLESTAQTVLSATLESLRLGERPLVVVPTQGPMIRRNRYWSEGDDRPAQTRIEHEVADLLVDRGCASGALATVDVLAWDGSHVGLDHEDSANIAAVVVLFDVPGSIFDVYELPLCRSSEGWQIRETVRPLPTGPGEGVPGSVLFAELSNAVVDDRSSLS